MNCDPSALANAARCWGRCVPHGTIQSAKSYLLCQIGNVGLTGLDIVPPGSVYSGGTPTFTLAVKPDTLYQITWGANDLSVNICGRTYTSTGAGHTTDVYTGDLCTTMVFTGTFAGTTVTVKVQPKPGAVAPPTGFTWTMSADGSTATAHWDTPPVTVASTELWTSTDGVNYALAGSNFAPNQNITVNTPAAGLTFYAKIRWDYKSGSSSFFTPALSVPDAIVVSWLSRITTNGGSTPAKSTIGAHNTFVTTLKTNSLWAKIKTLSLVPPDSVMAVQTPLISAGTDPWTFPASIGTGANLSVNGYLGRTGGNNFCMNTGANPNTLFGVNDGGISLYVSNNVATLDATGQWLEGGAATGGFAQSFMMATWHQNTNAAEWYCDDGGAPSIAQWVPGGNVPNGFYSGNRNAGANNNLYFANSVTAFSLVKAGGANTQTQPNNNVYAFGCNATGTPTGSFKTISFFAVHNALTATEAQALYNAVQAARTTMGGGFA